MKNTAIRHGRGDAEKTGRDLIFVSSGDALALSAQHSEYRRVDTAFAVIPGAHCAATTGIGLAKHGVAHKSADTAIRSDVACVHPAGAAIRGLRILSVLHVCVGSARGAVDCTCFGIFERSTILTR